MQWQSYRWDLKPHAFGWSSRQPRSQTPSLSFTSFVTLGWDAMQNMGLPFFLTGQIKVAFVPGDRGETGGYLHLKAGLPALGDNVSNSPWYEAACGDGPASMTRNGSRAPPHCQYHSGRLRLAVRGKVTLMDCQWDKSACKAFWDTLQSCSCWVTKNCT